MFDRIRADATRYGGRWAWVRELGFYVAALYRFGRWGRSLRAAPLRLAIRVVHGLLVQPIRFFRCVNLPTSADIGPGLRMVHAYGILVPPHALIGRNCSLYQDVTLGTGPEPGIPTVGNDVMIFAGARVLGGITVGDNVHVGANAVITRSVPAGATVVAPPARVLPPEIARIVRR